MILTFHSKPFSGVLKWLFSTLKHFQKATYDMYTLWAIPALCKKKQVDSNEKVYANVISEKQHNNYFSWV